MIEILEIMNNDFWENMNDFPDKNYDELFEKYDKKELLVSLFNVEFSPSFIISTLLYNTNLWYNLEYKEWKYILENVNRENGRFVIEDYGNYCDLIFLYKYIQVNSLSMLASCDLVDDKKIKILETIEILSHELIQSDFDTENFEDETYPNKSKYEEVCLKLIKNEVSKSKKTHSEIIQDIKDYKRKIRK